MRTSPPHSSVASVWLQLLVRLNYRKVVVLHTKGDANAQQFVDRFQIGADLLKIHVT
jgi:hypothetical protein